MSNLKLQKLVYYAQGFSLALLNRPLFNEEIEAWMHGPVVPELYRKYKDFKNQALPLPENDIDFSKFSEDEKELLDEVYRVYGQYSAWKLRDMTHSEPPWANSYIEGYGKSPIPHDSMKSFFDTRINK
ncbi:Panacea domain-containing protein [Candidatus Sodalis pierantonius]|uniref:Panacea domain-containing protein n=1 Tax=Candidatus Sodalis pierantonii TaxID=1486991 RepID=UPI001F37D972|nr:type II toxin-antitoxin system antitoxin SocA domain-containing protein [Candidatus Sodalis pierantonius]